MYLKELLLAGGMTEIEITSLHCLFTFAWIFPTISAVHFLAFAFLAITFWSKEYFITIEALISSRSVTNVASKLFRMRKTLCWTKAINCTSSGAFADDLICLFSSYQNLRLQAMKLTQYANWAHLIISCKKTKVTCMYHSDEKKILRGNTSVAEFAHHQLANKVLVQGQAAQFLKPDDPFPYLGVHITMDLNWSHQLTHMTVKLSLELKRLKNSFASPKQTMDIFRTAIVPSIAIFPSYPLLPKCPKSMGHTNSGSHKKQV